MGKKSNLGLCIIQGLIIPVEWDEKGNPLSVAVATFDEDEYLVHRDEKGDHLLGMLRKEVEVSGVVGMKDGGKTIKIKDYVLIKKPELSDETLEEKEGNHAGE